MFSLAYLFSQNGDKRDEIQRLVHEIDSDTSYTVKVLENEDFLVRNEVTDNGQQIKGYFKRGDIEKIVYWVGVSYCTRTYQFYLANRSLMFVFEKEENYGMARDSSNEWTGWDYAKLVLTFEGRYYFENGRMIGAKTWGKRLFDIDEGVDKEKLFLSMAIDFQSRLKNDKLE